jgi:Restriction endonuclease
VFKISDSGKLLAQAYNSEFFFELNNDLSFTSRKPHRVKYSSRAALTPYRLEIEVSHGNNGGTYRLVRAWNEEKLAKTLNPDGELLEQRINVSHSLLLNEYERKFVGITSGFEAARNTLTLSFALAFIVYLWTNGQNWKFSLAVLFVGAVGAIWTYTVYTTGAAPNKMLELTESKKRVRLKKQTLFDLEIADLKWWKSLSGIEFEDAVKKLFEKDGFDVKLTPRSNDQGVDLILKKVGVLTIVQCKAHKKPVGVAAVRELAGVRNNWPPKTTAMLVTLYDCSRQAQLFARSQNISLYSIAKDYLRSELKLE